MPIRIKPIHDLGPCILDGDSVIGLCGLIDQHFIKRSYSADDGFWEVFDADSQDFLNAIKDHQTLDSMRVVAEQTVSGIAGQGSQVQRNIELIFDKSQAKLKLSAPLSDAHWFDHFMIDLKKHLRPPLMRQRFLGVNRGEEDHEPLPAITLLASWIPFGIGDLIKYMPSARYCYILLKRNPPNPFIENIKANLVSNILWAALVFLLGIVFTVVVYWIYQQFSVNVNELNLLPIVPSSTPRP